MSDLTILYYSALKISPFFADAVRRELLASIGGRFPIIAVSHGELPASFCDQCAAVINIGPQPTSIVQVYRNILRGCQQAKTPFCASAEDDCLYVPDHWDYRPALDTFAYNEHRWILSRRLAADGKSRVGEFFFNPRTQMGMGIYPRELMIEALSEKFARYPSPPLDTNIAKRAGFGEPGRYEINLKLTPRKLERFKWTTHPCVTVNHSDSLMGRRAYRPDMPQLDSIEPWGNATALWERIVGS